MEWHLVLSENENPNWRLILNQERVFEREYKSEIQEAKIQVCLASCEQKRRKNKERNKNAREVAESFILNEKSHSDYHFKHIFQVFFKISRTHFILFLILKITVIHNFAESWKFIQKIFSFNIYLFKLISDSRLKILNYDLKDSLNCSKN